MAQYRICPHCGAYLDPGEPCDCQDDTERELPFQTVPNKRGESDVRDMQEDTM